MTPKNLQNRLREPSKTLLERGFRWMLFSCTFLIDFRPPGTSKNTKKCCTVVEFRGFRHFARGREKEAPGGPKRAPREAKMDPGSAPGGPRSGPRGPKTGPRAAKRHPRGFRKRFWSHFGPPGTPENLQKPKKKRKSRFSPFSKGA